MQCKKLYRLTIKKVNVIIEMRINTWLMKLEKESVENDDYGGSQCSVIGSMYPVR